MNPRSLNVNIPFPRPFVCRIYTIRVMYHPLFLDPTHTKERRFSIDRPVQGALLMLNQIPFHDLDQS
jgi:hypothetical protein